MKLNREANGAIFISCEIRIQHADGDSGICYAVHGWVKKKAMNNQKKFLIEQIKGHLYIFEKIIARRRGIIILFFIS